MLPILIGAAAAAIFLSGCGRHEESPPNPSAAPPEPSAPPLTSPRPITLSVPLRPPSAAPFRRPPAMEGCRSDGPRPERFAIQDPRAEFCRLHELLRGGACRIEGREISVSEERTLPSVFGLFPNLSDGSDFGAVARDPELRRKLGALEGLQTYLYSGRPCEFDQLGDLMDLMEAYSLYRAAFNAPQASLARAFREGRSGCILRRAIHRDEGVHDHEINGLSVHHTQSHESDAIATPASLALQGLPSSTPVSDCLILR